MKTIALPSAIINDLPLLLHGDEQPQPHIIASTPRDTWNWKSELNRDVEWQEMFLTELDGRSIGFLQIIDPACEETHNWDEIKKNCRPIDIWIVEKKELGKRYGTQMMTTAIER